MLKLKALISFFAFFVTLYLTLLSLELPQAEWRQELDLALSEKTNGLWFYDRDQNLIRVIKPQVEKNNKSMLDQKIYPISLEQVSPFFIQALLCLEDQSFHKHWGVPLEGIARAIWLNLRAGRFIAGGSGITQQVIKLFRGRARGLWSKLKEAQYALALENTRSKSDILQLYINHISFGPNITGIDAASKRYFSMPPHRLSLAQSAYLASLPLAPSRLSPYKGIENALPRQRAALSCMFRQEMINKAQYQRALSETIQLKTSFTKLQASHLTDSLAYGRLVKHFSPSKVKNQAQSLNLTIDHYLQVQIEGICRRYAQAKSIQGLRQLAAVGLDLESGEVLFWVGSQDYAHPDAGQVDHVLGLRLPGSTLKPFLYALALDSGYSLNQRLPDRALYFKTPRGQYRPQNYDHKHRGEVKLMSALAMSLNIPSVYLLNELGVSKFLHTLREVGLKSLDQNAEHYGLGLSLGDGEVRLIDLVNAYRIFGKQGKYSPWRLITNTHNSWKILPQKTNKPSSDTIHLESPKQVISARSAQAILHTLSSQELRAPAFGYQSPLSLPFPSAVKTGTGQGYSDAWTIGLSAKYVVGVWVLPKFGTQLSGGMIAAPLWHEIMLALHQNTSSLPFNKQELNESDQQVLEQLIQLENSRYQQKFFKQVDDVNNRSLNNQQSHIQLGVTAQANQMNPHKNKIKVVNPPEGAEYHYLPQRSPHDNLLRAEIFIDDKLISKKDRGELYRLKWVLNHKQISTTSNWSKSIWIDPWAEHSLNQKLCVTLQSKSSLQTRSWIEKSRACSDFIVYPKSD